MENDVFEITNQKFDNDELLPQSLLTAKEILEQFAVDLDFESKLTIAFGNDFDVEKSEELRQKWAVGDFAELPEIEIRSGEEINGANSAYSIDTNKIYISQEYINQNVNNLKAIADSIVEEVGHYTDAQINLSDAVGDEGAIFLAQALDDPLSEEKLLELRAENDIDFINLDGQTIQIEKASVSDSGGFEGSQKTITLESNGGGVARYSYEHFTIPDNFIIRYEGQNILETGFVGGSKTGTVQIPEGDSNELEIIVATNDSGTAWNYTVETLENELNIQDAYVAVEEGDSQGDSQTATIKFPVTLSEPSNVETTVRYFTLVGTAVDGKTGNDKIDYQPVEETLTFAPGETEKEIEISVLGDTPVNFGGDDNFEIFARDTAYRNWQEGEDIDFNSTLSYGDLGYRVDKFFNDTGTGFQAAGLTSDENFFVLISDPVNADIEKDSGEERDRLLTQIDEFLGEGDDTTSDTYKNAVKEIDELEARDTSWTFATGTIYDLGKDPVLAIRGTEQNGQDVWADLHPNGVGYAQYTNNRDSVNSVNQWLQEVSNPEDTDVSFKPHITGHSLGGALTQWVAADYSSQGALGEIVTFNAPGISVAGANSFAGAEKVTHYITSTDVVSMAGFRYLPGQYTLLDESGSIFNQIPLDGPHTHPVIIDKVERTGAKKPSLDPKTFPSVDSLNSPLFTYLPDPDYFIFLVAVSNIPILGPTVATALVTRGTAELARTAIGGTLYTIANFDAEYAKAAVRAAWEAAKQWTSDAWDAIVGWGEDAWDAVSSWTVDAWNATTQWVSDAWNATTQWTSDAWDATKQWTSDAWNATTEWVGDAWDATTQWTSDAWDATTQWTSDAWDATTQWTSDAWDATTEWVGDAWDATTQWTSDAWDATTEWSSSAWEATTEWFGSFFRSSSSLRSLAAVEETQVAEINSPWEATTYWSAEAWEATTQWSDAAWEATTQWGLELWQATTEWTAEAWEATTRWTDDIWQATAQLDSAAGDEILFGSPSSDNLSGESGNDILNGLDDDDVLDGGEGDDILVGQSGNDVLMGGTGGDSFVFNNPTEGVDTIEDFESSEGDRIVVSAIGFGGELTQNATLEESQFVQGTTAIDSDDRFIYDPATGNLFFDPDGIGDAPQQQIATLTDAPTLSASDIFVSGNSTVPTIKVTAPATDVRETEVTIEWNAFDTDSQATISLFYDTDNQGFDGVLIVDGLTETDGQGSFLWNTENLPQEDYFIYAAIDDGTNPPVFSYSKGQVQLKPVEEVDLSVTQTASAASVGVGENLTYTIEVTNNGAIASQEVTLVETIPETATFVSANLTPSEQTDNIFTFELGDLAAGESQIVEITVVAPAFADTITANTAVSSETVDTDPTNNFASLSTEVTAGEFPDLEVTRTDDTASVPLGTTYSYTLDVTNNGSANATGVVLTENLPSGLNVISATAETGSQTDPNFVDIIELQLDDGEQVTIDIDARILGSSLDPVIRLFDSAGTQVAVSDDTAAPGEPSTLDSYINFTASTTDTYYVGVSNFSNFSYDPFVDGSGNPGSSSGSYDIEIIVGSDGTTTQGVLDEPNNTISQAVDSGLSSENTGTFVASGFIDSNNTSTNPVTINNDVVTANLGNLSNGETATVNLTVSPFVAGNLVSTTNVTSNEADSNPLNNQLISTKTVDSVVPAGADLELTTTVNNLNPEVGDQIIFTLTLTNNGPGVASSIEVTDLLPSELSFVSASTVQGTYDSNTGIWDVGNLRDNLSRSLTIVANVEQAGSFTNVAEVTAVSEVDPDSTPGNNNPNEDDQDEINITVISDNNPPDAEEDKIVTIDEDAEATPLNIAAPIDEDGDSLTITVTTIPDPTKGEIRLADDTAVSVDQVLTVEDLQELVFVPVANANGNAGEFSYVVSDGIDGVDSQTVTLEINPINDSPVAQNDTASTDENTPVTILATDLLANDSDVDLDTLNIIGVDNAINGSVEFNQEGDIVFTPEPNFSGDASFEYIVSDDNNGSDTATVSINVNPDGGQNNEIEGTSGRDNLTGTDDDDIITGFQGRDIIAGGEGEDQFVYISIRDAGDIITDFEVGSDKIVLTELLDSIGYSGSNPINDGYVSFGSQRENTVLLIDTDGIGGRRASSLLTVENVSINDFNNSDNFVF